jgi:hypothetical protein
MILRVMVRPNSAFTEIRDNDQRYFAWSVGIYIGLVLLSVYVGLYYAVGEYVEDKALSIVVAISSDIIFLALIYLFGRVFSGNTSWRKVFSTIFYAHVIPMFVLIGLILLTVGFIQLNPLDGPGLGEFISSISVSEFIDGFWVTIAFLIALFAIMVAFVVWGIVLLVKAVKIVNGFGTAQAFVLIVVAGVVTGTIFAPFSM